MCSSFKYMDKKSKVFFKIYFYFVLITLIIFVFFLIFKVDPWLIYLLFLPLAIVTTLLPIAIAILERKSSEKFHREGEKVLLKTNLDEALELTKKAIDMNPEDPSYWNTLGLLYSEKKESQKAIEAFLKALELNLKYNSIQKDFFLRSTSINLAYEYITIKEYSQAKDTLERILGAFRYDHRIFSDLGHVYILLNDYDKAIEACSKAIELNSKSAKDWSNLGFAYYNKKEFEKGIEYIHKAIKINPNHPRAYFCLTSIQYDKGNYSEALEKCEKALTLDQNFAEALELKQKLLLK